MKELSDYLRKMRLQKLADLIDLPTPNQGKLVYVKHDGRPRNKVGDPETFRCWDDQWFPVDTWLYRYWQQILMLFSPTMPAAEFLRNWHSLTRNNCAMTNKHGWNSGDFKLNGNIYFGGTTKRLTTGRLVKKGGEYWYEVYALKISDLRVIPQTIAQVDLTLHVRPVTATAIQLPDGTYRADAFGQFDGNSIYPFISTSGRSLIHASNAIILPDQNIPSPFYP